MKQAIGPTINLYEQNRASSIRTLNIISARVKFFNSSLRQFLKKITPGWIRYRLYPFFRNYNKGFILYFFNHFVAKIPCFTIRTWYLRKILKIKIGKGSALHMHVFITDRAIKIGENNVISRRCYLDGRGGIETGNNVSISPEAYIISASHYVNDPEYNVFFKKVTIDDYVWIGARALIMPGIHIGKGAVVGAGAVVTRDVAPFTIVAGNPAREIGKRSEDLTYKLNFFSVFDTDIPIISLFKK
jgi:maltose O-acetyltransferase